MEESHNTDLVAELADAMKSDQSLSSSSSFETIPDVNDKINSPEAGTKSTRVLEFSKWKCRLDRNDINWILYIDTIPTYLQFKGDQYVSLETSSDERLYLKVDGNLHIVSISEDGKAKIVPVSDISCTSQTAEEKEQINSLTDNQFEEYVPVGASENNRGKTDLKNIEKDEKCEGTCESAQGESLQTIDIDKEQVQIQPVGKTTVTQIQEATAVSTSTLRESATEVQTQESNDVPTAKKRSDGNMKSQDDKIKLIKKDKHWILLVGIVETIVDFDEKVNVTLQICDEDVYLKADEMLFEVTINPSGTATVTQIQEAIVVLASTTSETENGSQAMENIIIPTVTRTSTSGDTMKGEFDKSSTKLDYGAATVNQNVTDVTYHADEDIQSQTCQNLIELFERERRWILRVGTVETDIHLDDRTNVTMFQADGDFYIKTSNKLYEVKTEADGRACLVPVSEATVIPASIDNTDKIASNVDDKYETFMNDDSKRNYFQSEEGTVNRDLKVDERPTVASSNEELIHANEQDLSIPPSSNSAADDVSSLADMLGNMNIKHDTVVDKASLTVGKDPISNDRMKNTQLHTDEKKSSTGINKTKAAVKAAHKTADHDAALQSSETHTSTTGTRSTTQPDGIGSSRTEHAHLTTHTNGDIKKESLTAKIKKRSANDETGARPKQATRNSGRNNEDTAMSVRKPDEDTHSKHNQSRMAAKFSNTMAVLALADVSTNEHGQGDFENRERVLRENNESDTGALKSPGIKDISKQGRAIYSTAVKVDNINVFNYLKRSKYTAQLAKDNAVVIENIQITDCQGFEIKGEPRAVPKVEDELKKTIDNIKSDSSILKGGRKSIAETKDNLLRMKTKIEENFDVSIDFVEQKTTEKFLDENNFTGKVDVNGKSSDSRSKSLSNDKENGIEKIDEPDMVSWHFPGGYRISLCKTSVKQSMAVVHVQFTRWNGKDKQLNKEVWPDGMGGYIIEVTAGLPRRRESRNETEDIKHVFASVLKKTGEEDQNSVAFSIEEMQDWNLVSFLESLLSSVWEHFKAPKSDKPVFIELCIPKNAEYQAANYQCHRLVTSLMDKEIGCIKSQPLELKVVEDKLNCTQAEVLVNTTSRELRLNAGAVSSALLKTGGEGLQYDCNTFYPKGIDWGEMAITRSHQLPCKYVFHGALPPYQMQLSDMEKLTAFRNLMDLCLTKAADLGCRTIAFPVLGAGNLRYPVDLVAAEMFICVQKFQNVHKRTTLQTVYFVVYPADKATLQKFRRIQSDLKVAESDTPKQRQQASDCEAAKQDKKDWDVVESVKVEITGLKSVVKEASKCMETDWKKLISEKEHLFAVRLPSSLGQAICYGQNDRLTQRLEDLGAEVAETNSNFFIRAPTLKILKLSFTIVNEFYIAKDGQHCTLGPFREMEIIARLQNVTETDFKVMENMYKSTLDKCSKMETKIHYKGKSIVIKGKAENTDSIANEIQNLITYIKKLETCCIDVDELKIGKETIDAIIKEVEARKDNICILLETEKGQLRLFTRQIQTLNDLKNEVLDKIKSYTIKEMSDSSTKQEHTQPYPENKMPGTESTRRHVRISPIRIPTCSGELKIFVYEGDLLKAPVACIVNASNEYLTHNAGVAAAVANAAGPKLITESLSHFSRYGKVSAGDIVITTAGYLNYRCVIHAVGPSWRDYKPLTQTTLQNCKLALQSAIRNCLDVLERNNLKSVAIPAISAGYQGVPLDICAIQYAEAISRYLEATSRPSIEEIHFVDLNQDTVKQIAQTFHAFFIDKKVVSSDSKYLPVEQAAPEMTVVSHAGKDAVKFTGRSKTEHGNMPHSGQSASSSRTELRPKTGEAKSLEKVLSDPVIYESSTKTTIIRFSDCHELQFYTANILQLEAVDAIVLSEDLSGSAKGCIAQGMVEKGGAKYISEKRTVFHSKLSFGEVIVTSGGKSRFHHVFHALVHHRQHFSKDNSKWYDAFRKILGVIFKKAVLFQCRSIAMPLLGIDSRVKDVSEYVNVFVESYKSFCPANSTQQLTVHLISNEPSLTTTLKSVFYHVVSNKQSVSGSTVAKYPPTLDMLKADRTAKKEAASERRSSTENDHCVICLEKVKLPKKLRCGHTFCKDCIDQHLKTKNNCPVCGKVLGKITGNQPSGTMKHDVVSTSLTGYEKYKTIRIVYSFTSGIQGAEHPEPGKHYTGISRVAFLPDNDDGRQILKLLRISFDRKLTFTIGQSRTTGQSGVITWNDIHHKTNTNPNTQFGYPDPTYFDRVKDELAAKGVTVDDIK